MDVAHQKLLSGQVAVRIFHNICSGKIGPTGFVITQKEHTYQVPIRIRLALLLIEEIDRFDLGSQQRIVKADDDLLLTRDHDLPDPVEISKAIFNDAVFCAPLDLFRFDALLLHIIKKSVSCPAADWKYPENPSNAGNLPGDGSFPS